MGFKDENGYSLINEEQKVRVALSERAKLIMAEDMNVFSVSKTSTFINTVFENYYPEAKSSISLYLQRKKLELDRLFTDAGLDNSSLKITIELLLKAEKENLLKQVSEYQNSKGDSRLYHINDANVSYLVDDCDENNYYDRPGQYIRSVIEEYCLLPFIERERIYRKPIYEKVEQACNESQILKIKAQYQRKEQLFYVYPYRIVPAPLHTQSYLVCYSRKAEEDEKDKTIASFSMARLSMPTKLNKTFHLNKQEKNEIETQIAKYSPAYLIGKPEQIKVRLTEKGKLSYQSRLSPRPEKIELLSSDDIYVFDCTHQQIFDYFFPFGADAEIISPESLRTRFQNAHNKASQMYNAAADG